jgi:hypothetical protein
MTDEPTARQLATEHEKAVIAIITDVVLYARRQVDQADLTEFQKVMIREGVATKLLRANRASLGFLGEEVHALLDEDMDQ